MRKNVIWIGGAAVLGIVVACFAPSGDAVQVLVWPFTALGGWLRMLSLASQAGNVLAFALYIAVCLAPAACIAVLRRKEKQSMDFLWGALSAYSFFLFYHLINPHKTYALFPTRLFGEEAIPSMQFLLIVMFASLLLACIVFRLMGKGKTRDLLRQFSGMILLVQLLTVFVTVAMNGRAFAEKWMGASGMNRLSVVTDQLASTLPNILVVWLLNAVCALTDSMKDGWYGAESGRIAEVLKRRGHIALYVTVFSMLAANTANLVFAQYLQNIHVDANIPITQMLTACGATLLARFVSDSRRVKRENDLMI